MAAKGVWPGRQCQLTLQPVTLQTLIQSLTPQSIVDRIQVIHGQVALVALEEEWVQPGKECISKDALYYFGGDFLAGHGGVAVFVYRFDEQQKHL